MSRASVLLPLALAAAASLSACGAGSSPGNGTASPAAGGGTVVPVVAAENVWGDITRQIGGGRVRVTSILTDPNTDPHSYETDPKDAAAISQASFVVLNGLGYDDFASKLLAASPDSARTVVSLDKVNGVSGSSANPHLWYNPSYVKASADAIAAQLTKVDPADAPTFAANEQAFLAAYQPYVDQLARIKERYHGVQIAYTERLPGYLVEAAGLVLGTPASFSKSLEDGNEPSATDTATFNADITGRKVKVLLYNGQVTDKQTDAIKALAVKAGVPVVGVAETIPPDQRDFQSWQIAQAAQVFAALGG